MNATWVSRPRVIWSAALIWLALVAAGLAALAAYSYAPGRAGEPPSTWPSTVRIHRATDRATLVMLAHPYCPCTRSSIEELSKLMARAGGHVAAHVMFLKPEGSAVGWEHSGLWESAAAIPGVQVWSDPDGAEAGRFGAFVSGQVVLYDEDGRLLFSGGITAARGHAGDNAGSVSALLLLKHATEGQSRTPVFGCSLRTPHAK